MALPTSLILTDNQLLSFQVGFSSYSHVRKAHTSENSKAKSWGRGILDLDFDARKCIIRTGEHTLLMESFQEFQAVVIREDDSDHFLTITFDSDEWDIVPQNVAETACILHLAQYIGKGQMITATEVVKSGIQKGILGLEQTPIFKQGLLQQHDQRGRKLQARFLVVVPGKMFGFQRQQEMVGCPASFVTSLFNARVTTLMEAPGFQLYVDRSEPLYFDTLQDVECPSWVKELNASIEVTKNALNGISIMSRPFTRTSKVQWKDSNQDAQQQLSSSTGSSNDQVGPSDASMSQKKDLMVASVGFDPTEQVPTNAQVHDESSQNLERDVENRVRSKPLSRARICLEDSLSELEILVGHIQAASHVLNDLRLFTSSNHPRDNKYPSPTMSRWSSTGKERSWPHTNWQHHHLSDRSYQDLMIWPESNLSSRFEQRDLLHNTRNYLKVPHKTSLTGGWKDARTVPYLQTTYQKQPVTYQKQPIPAMGEPGQVQGDNGSFYSSADSLPLDIQNSKTGRKSTIKQTCSLNATGDINEVQPSQSDAELSSRSHSETQENDETASSQQLIATPTSQKNSTMIKPGFSCQASTRASRAVAFMAHPDILNDSDEAPSQMQGQSQTVEITKAASDDSASRQSSSMGKPYRTLEPRASQTEFPLKEYQAFSREDIIEDNPSANTRQSQSSGCKSTQEALGNTQSRQSCMQAANLTELLADRNEGGFGFDSNTLAVPDYQTFDGVVIAQNDDEHESRPNSVGKQGSNNVVSKSRDRMETRKSTPNYNSSFLGESQQGGRRQIYEPTNQDMVPFQPEMPNGLASRQLQASSFQPGATSQSETKKNFATRQSQKAMSLPEIKKSIALNRRSEDATFLPETRKSTALSRQSTGNVVPPEVRKSIAVNKQNQDSTSLPDTWRNVASYRQSSMQQPATRSSSNMSVPSNAYAGGELRKSTNEVGGNHQTESDFQELETNQVSGEMYDLHQEGDLSDMSSSVSSSSRSSIGPLALDESAKPELSAIDSPNTIDPGEIVAPAAPAKLENRKSMVTSSTNNERGMEQVAAASNQQRLPSRPNAYESSRAFMRSNTTTPRSHNQESSYKKFDDRVRGVNDRRHSQS